MWCFFSDILLFFVGLGIVCMVIGALFLFCYKAFIHNSKV